jgi:menaquinone-dependent protoporphyrinogen oxidase
MNGRPLVAYATKHGSTQEVAEAIAKRLCSLGACAEVARVESIESLSPYSAVILGSPLYGGHWQRETAGFLKRHRVDLTRLPVAVFALGPRGKPGEADWDHAERQLSAILRKYPWLRPVSRQLVGAVIVPSKLRFPFSHMPACDWRDWDAIDAWADSLPPLLAIPPVAATA